ncbi:MAG: hypothetical protein H6923_01245 [Alphaproteobacteria bacterium]|nr:hypothetical protein [Alphaproteobacteria bacterium]
MDHDDSGAFQGPLDGNSAAGLLQEVFVFEATSAILTCAGCGAAGPIGATRLYGGAMGAVLRCAHCDTALLRVTRTEIGIWLDMQGARSLLMRDAPAA